MIPRIFLLGQHLFSDRTQLSERSYIQQMISVLTRQWEAGDAEAGPQNWEGELRILIFPMGNSSQRSGGSNSYLRQKEKPLQMLGKCGRQGGTGAVGLSRAVPPQG